MKLGKKISLFKRNIKKIALLQLLFIALFAAPLLPRETRLEVDFSSKEIFLGDLITLKVTAENIDESEIVILANDFNNLGRFSQQNQILVVDGKVKRKKIFYYRLQPLKVGKNDVTILASDLQKGPFIIEVNEKALKPLKNRTKAIVKHQKNFLIRNFLTKKELRLNETAILKTVLYFIDLPRDFHINKSFLHEGLNMTPVKIESEPFAIEEIGGKFYKKQTIDQYLVYPYKTGVLEIANGSYLVKEGSSSFFFIKNDLEVAVPKIKIVVKPYEDPPVGFENNWGIFELAMS